MIGRIFLLFVLSAISVSALAQDRIKLIGLETGINFVGSEMSENERIRASSSDYYGDGFYSESIEAQMSRAYGGVKAEIRSLNNVFGFTTGLRYSLISTSISKRYSPDHFYFMFRQSGTTTEYLRIKRIDQLTSYVSVPLEVRVCPYRQRTFRLYFLAGTEVGYKITSKDKVEFVNPSMEQYESDVASIIEEPGSLFSTFYGRAGFIIGGEKPFLDIGITLPFAISGSATSLAEPNVGGGFHLQVLKKF